MNGRKRLSARVFAEVNGVKSFEERKIRSRHAVCLEELRRIEERRIHTESMPKKLRFAALFPSYLKQLYDFNLLDEVNESLEQFRTFARTSKRFKTQ